MGAKPNIGDWIVTIVLFVVLFAVMAGLYPTLLSQANAFKNATGGNAMAVVIVTLLPILLAAAVLIIFVFAVLPRLHSGKSGRY